MTEIINRYNLKSKSDEVILLIKEHLKIIAKSNLNNDIEHYELVANYIKDIIANQIGLLIGTGVLANIPTKEQKRLMSILKGVMDQAFIEGIQGGMRHKNRDYGEKANR